MSSSRQFSPAPSPDLTHGTGGSLLDTVPEVHLLDRLAVVFKHMRLISAVFAIVVAIAMLESYSATPMYRSLSRIVIQDERMTAIGRLNSNDPAYWQDPEPYFNTQYRILQSRGLARRVIRTMPPPPPAQPSAFSRCRANWSTAGASARCARRAKRRPKTKLRPKARPSARSSAGWRSAR